MLKAYFGSGGLKPVLLLHQSQYRDESVPNSDNIIAYRLETLGSCGIDVWLSAIAYGADRVLLFDNGDLTTATRRTLNEQLELAGNLLTGMGYSKNRVQLIAAESALAAIDKQPLQRADFAGDNSKRTMLRMAIDHLYHYAPNKTEAIDLPDFSMFGKITVAEQRCTLCMSCIAICPAGALLSGREMPLLKLIESACVQCGLCQAVCPEQAITLVPQYRYDSLNARKPEIIHQDEIVHCLKCNKAFASKSMIDNIRNKLQHHAMFQGENADRLMMCEDCRVNIMFEKS